MASVISNKRDLTIDLAKVLCMAYIVFYRHLANYGDVYSARHYLSYEVTISVMGVFMFYGGWFFKKADFNSLIGVKKFYKRRFYRFYILFLLSILLLCLGGLMLHKPWFDSNLQLILTSLGLSSFYQPNVNTLWFMSMLMLFYILTPFILKCTDAKWNYIKACMIFVGFLISYLIWPDHIDFRLPLFFFFYAGGILMPHNEWNEIRYNHSIIGMLIGTVVFIAFAMLSLEGQGGNMLFKVLYGAGFLLWMSALSSCLNKVLDKWLGGAVSVLSYIMLAAYLFHRHIYQLMKYIIENIMDYPLNGYHLAFVFVPACIILSYCIQYAYDLVIQHLYPRKS